MRCILSIKTVTSRARKGFGRRFSVPHSKNSESGNIFFALFAAVALIGILGAVTMAVMRGPLTTMVEVQNRTQAESEMAIASRLALLEATELAQDGDCDSDGFVEPLEWTDAAGNGPTGGGFLPSEISSSRQDPWGTEYGYCAWDAGNVIDAIACDNGGGTADTIYNRLDGNADANDETYTVIAIISAGPDQIFDTTCIGGASPDVTKGGDDIVTEYTYQAAATETGGLWNLKSGDPATAEIDKNLEVTGGASFTDGIDLTGSSSALQLGAASMLYPNETTLATCNGANDGLIRINTSINPDRLELCDDPTGWIPVGGLGLWSQGTGDDIYYNTGTPQVGIGTTTPDNTLDIAGTLDTSGAVTFGDTLDVVGATTLAGTTVSTFGATGAADLDSTLNVDGATTLSTLGATGAVDFDSTLNVDGASTLVGAINAQGTIANSAGDVSVGDNLVVTGTSSFQGDISNAGTAAPSLRINDDLEVTGSVDFDADLTVADNATFNEDVSIAGNLAVTGTGDFDGVLEASDFTWGGNDFTPATCASGSFNRWDGTEWVCDADTVGSGGGGASSLNALSDVNLSSPAGGQCLVYNAGAGEWVNTTCTGVFETTGAAGSEVVRTVNTAAPYATADFVFGSTQLASTGNAAHWQRMFFDKSKGAFRAGSVTGTEWDDANVGSGSTALGTSTIASGVGSTALGVATQAAGTYSTSMGFVATANGSGSMAIGLTDLAALPFTRPVVSGNYSLGIFMGNQDGYNLNVANRMALVGGDFLIDDAGATGSQGCMRYNGTNSELEYSNDCTTFTAFNDIAGTPGGANTQVQYNDNGAFGGDAGLTYDDTNNILTVGNSVVITGQAGNAPTYMNLDDLGDVDASSPANGECIVYNNGSGYWEAATCTVSGTAVLSGISAATANNSINNGAWNQVWNWQLTGAETGFKFGENVASTGGSSNQYILGAETLAASTAIPFFINNLGNGRSFQVNDASGDTTPFVIDSSGRVGVGTASPGSLLHVEGTYHRIRTGYSNGGNEYGIDATAFETGSGHSWGITTGTTSNPSSAVTALGVTVNNAAGRGALFSSSSITTGSLLDFSHGTSAFSGNMIQANLANASGSFSGNFIRFQNNSDQKFYVADDGEVGAYRYCDEDGNNCFTAASAAGATLWTDNTTHITRENFHILDAGLAAGSTTAGLDGDGIYTFYDPDKGAMRGGEISGGDTARQNTNVGVNSFAWGQNAMASGDNSFAFGNSVQATNTESFAVGHNTIAGGNNSFAGGWGAQATGNNAFSFGETTLSGGESSFAIGYEATASGDHSFAFGLGNATAAQPIVSGQSSFGIFMGNQSGVVVSANNVMAILGGNVGIGTNAPTSRLHVPWLSGDTATTAVFGSLNASNNRGAIYAASGDNIAIFGESGNYAGVHGLSNLGAGVYGVSQDGFGVSGSSNSDISGFFSAYNATNTSPTLVTQQNGAGTGDLFQARNAGGTALVTIDSTGRTLIGTTTATTDALLKVGGTGSIMVPVGTDAQRPGTGAAGMIRYNTTLTPADTLEYYDAESATWRTILASGGAGTVSAINDLTDALKNTTDNNLFMAHEGGSVGANNTQNTGIGIGALDSLTNSAGANEGDNNTALGYNALTATTTGSENTAIGHGALNSVTIGGQHTAVGVGALGSTASGYSHVAIGYSALGAMSGGVGYNVAVGAYAMHSATYGNANIGIGGSSLAANSGDYNIGIGFNALNSNVAKTESVAIGHESMRYADDSGTTAVSYNTALGAYSLRGSTTAANNTGTDNTAIGHSALLENTTGIRNTAVGRGALDSNTTAAGNTALGYNALASVTTGQANIAVGHRAMDNSGVNVSSNTAVGHNAMRSINSDGNTGVGYAALHSTTTGIGNVALGYNSLANNVDGAGSVALGYAALSGVITGGTQNTALGFQAGDNITTGDQNIMIGYDVDALSATADSQLNIGNTIYGDLANDRVGIGMANTTSTLTVLNSFSVSNGTNSVGGMISSTGHGRLQIRDSNGVLTTSLGPYNSGSPNYMALGTGLTIGSTATARGVLDLGYTTNALVVPSGTVAQRPGTPAGAMVRYNTDSTPADTIEYYDAEGATWRTLLASGAGAVSAIDDLTDAETDYATDFNMFMGSGAGAAIATGGQYNIAIGQNALNDVTVSDGNLAIGYGALDVYNSAADNDMLAIGTNALGAAQDGRRSIAIGSDALGAWDGTPASSDNVVVGASAMPSLNSGGGNVVLGTMAGRTLIDAGNNVFVGTWAGGGPTYGQSNINNNVFLGMAAGEDIETGAEDNIVIGAGAGNTDFGAGTDNILIGTNTQLPSDGADYHLNIGNTIYGDFANDYVGIGLNDPASELVIGNHNAGDTTATLKIGGSGGNDSGQIYLVEDLQDANERGIVFRYDGTVNNNFGIYPVFNTVLQTVALGIDRTTGAVGIGTITPTTGVPFKVAGTGSIMIPAGTDAQRPGTGAAGMLRYNSTATPNDKIEYYDAESAAWVQLAGGAGGSNLWTDNTTHISRGNMHVLNAGETMTDAGFDGGMGDAFVWHNDRAALRIGTTGNTSWNEANIGQYSFAHGEGGLASGYNSVVLAGGYATGVSGVAMIGGDAAGEASLAVLSHAGADYSMAFGLSGEIGPAATHSVMFNIGGTYQQMNLPDTFVIQGGDFLVGSTTLDDAGVAANDARMFFDKSKGAFRAGIADGVQWDDANVGASSIGLGTNTMAVGDYSIAMGQSVSANGDGSTAIGFDVDAGLHATAIGRTLLASGESSIALGSYATAVGDYSMALGLGSTAGGSPIVSGNNSFGIFMGDQDSYDLNVANRMGIVGGHLMIDDAIAGSQGCIRYVQGTGLQFSHDCTTYTTMGGVTPGVMAINDLSDAVTDYTTDHNMRLGSNTAMTSGAINNLFIGESSGTAGTSNAADHNIAIGFQSLDALTTGNQNTALGVRSLTANTTGANNIAIGHESLDANLIGNYNTAIGSGALGAATEDENTAVGYSALNDTTTGEYNVALGTYALNTNRAREQNTALGHEAMRYADSTTTANEIGYNTAVGFRALRGSGTPADNTGTSNTAIGHNSMINNTSGALNTAVGASTLNANTSASENTAVGVSALASATTGGLNTAVGTTALADNTTGFENVAVGRRSLENNTTGIGNIGVGTSSLSSNIDGGGNVAIGYHTLNSNIDGSDNISIGNSAGDNLTTGNGNIAIGANVDFASTTGFNQLNIGNTIYGDLSTDQVAIGTATQTTDVQLKVAGTGSIMVPAGTDAQRPGTGAAGMVRYNSTATPNDKIEYYDAESAAWVQLAGGAGGGAAALNDLSDAMTNAPDNNMTIGHEGTSITATSGQYNLSVGLTAGDAITTGDDNVAIGPNAMSAVTTGTGNTVVGSGTMESGDVNNTRNSLFGTGVGYNLTGTGNALFGSEIMSGSGGRTGSYNVAMGYDTMRYKAGSYNIALGFEAMTGDNGSDSASNNIALGQVSLHSVSSGGGNIAIGYYSAAETTESSDNIAIGSHALHYNVAKSENVAIGLHSMYYADSTATPAVSYNTALGAYSLRGSTTAADNTGTFNTALGHSALMENTSGSNNTAIGFGSLMHNTDGEHNIAIGRYALANAAAGASDNVAIGSSTLGAAGGSTTGTRNSVIGRASGYSMTSGGENVALGYQTLLNVTTGNDNTAIGAWAMSGTDADATNNTAIGQGALFVVEGNNNTALGWTAGENITTGSNNIVIGYDVDAPVATGSDQLNIGNTIYSDLATDRVAIGTATLTTDIQFKVAGTGGIMIPSGTDAQRPGTGAAGMVRVNTTASPDALEFYNAEGSAWVQIGAGGGAAAINDLSDAITNYPSNNMFLGLNSGGTVTTASENTALGTNALASLVDPIGNVAVGDGAGRLIDYGSANTAIGSQALYTSAGAHGNTAIGDWALHFGTGGDNTAIGRASLENATTADDNVAIGAHTLFENRARERSVAIGTRAMQYAYDGTTANQVSYNTAIGYEALRGSSTPADNDGHDNTAIGYSTLANNTTGSFNQAIGVRTLISNTTGVANTAIGDDALGTNTTGYRNIAIGNQALYDSVSAFSNVAIGHGALEHSTGNSNTVIGDAAGSTLTSGMENILIGYDVETTSASESFQLNIGNTIYGDLSTDRVAIGTDAQTAGIQFKVAGTGGIMVPAGTDAQRPGTGAAGMVRYNSTATPNDKIEYYDAESAAWVQLAGGAGGASPAAPDRSLQFNNAGAFGGSANLTYSAAGELVMGGITATNGQSVRFFEAQQVTSGDNLFFIEHSANGGEGTTYLGSDYGTYFAFFNDYGDMSMNATGGDIEFFALNGYHIDVPDGQTRSLFFDNISGGWTAAQIEVTKTSGSNSRGTMEIKTDVDNQLFLDSSTNSGFIGIGTASPAASLHINRTSTAGNTAVEGLRISHTDSNSAGSSSIGTYISMTAESDSAGVMPEIARMESVMTDATNASKDSDLRFYTLGPNATAGSNTATEKVRIDSTGRMLVGTTTATTGATLKVGSTDSIMIPAGTDAQRPSTGAAGMIRYNTDATTNDRIEYYDAESAGWIQLATGSGGSNLWTDNTTHITRGNFHILNAGLAAGSTTAGLDGDGTYSFYDPDKGAMRGGAMAFGLHYWQDTEIGLNSFAWGRALTASGDFSVALGDRTGASGESSFAVGYDSFATNNQAIAMGDTAMATGWTSFALGHNVMATADHAVAFGLSDTAYAAPDRPRVSGENSFGIFMGDQTGVDLSDTNTFAIMGASGGFGIGTVTPSAPLEIFGAEGTADARVAIGDVNNSAAGFISYDSANSHPDTNNMMRFSNAYNNANNDGGFQFWSGGQDDTQDFAVLTMEAQAGLGIGILDNTPDARLEISMTDSWNNTSQAGLMISSNEAGNGDRLLLDSTGRLMVGTATATTGIQFKVAGTGGIMVPAGTDAQRPGTGAAGMVRYNSTATPNDKIEYYDAESAAWVQLTGGAGGGASALNDLSDSYTDYTTDFNMIIGGNPTTTTGLASGARFNLFIGQGAGATTANSTSDTDRNVAVGYESMTALTTGADNTAIGYSAAPNLTTGFGNVAVGRDALLGKISGDSNIGIGFRTLAGSGTGGYGNIAIGEEAINAHTVGVENIGIGSDALKDNETGSANVAVGNATLANSTTDDQTAIGWNALATAVTAIENTAVGRAALTLNTGDANTAVGFNAMTDTTTGGYNTALGRSALSINSSGSYNTALGESALGAVTTGEGNVAVGHATLDRGDIGNFMGNVAVGSNSMRENEADGNTAVGQDSMHENVSGEHNVAVGQSALRENIDGSDNTAVGWGALSAQISGGTRNLAIGYQAGNTITTGTNNIMIGRAANPINATDNYALNIGDAIFGDLTNNHISIGTAYLTTGIEFKVYGTGGIMVPAGTDAQRPGTGAAGMVRYNSTATPNDKIEYYDAESAAWVQLGAGGAGGAINDLSDAITDYPNANMYLGTGNGDNTTTGQGNTGLGDNALAAIVDASGTTAVGRNALGAIEGGGGNSAFGNYAMSSMNGGSDNTAIGGAAGGALLGGNGNTAIGSTTMYAPSTRSYNTAVGFSAMEGGGTGSNNTALGVYALQSNSGKEESTAVGYQSMRYSDDDSGTATSYNTAVGSYSLRGSTTAANNTGTSNTALGHSALLTSTSGDQNTAVGVSALEQNSSGSNNIALGVSALYLNDTGNSNIGIGYSAGSTTTTGNGNISIGYNVQPPSASSDSRLNIGDTIYGDMANDYIGIGNNAPSVALDVTGDIEYTGTITDVSDARLKDNIKPLIETGSLLERIDAINTYSFNMKDDETKRTEFGVMAQELENIFPELVHTAKDEMGTKSVNYVGLIAPMIEATKELRAENKALKAEITQMKESQAQITASLGDLTQQVALLNKAAGNSVGKASMEGWLYLLIGLMLGGMAVLVLQRKKMHS